MPFSTTIFITSVSLPTLFKHFVSFTHVFVSYLELTIIFVIFAQIQVKEEVVVEDSTKSTREYRLEEIQERERLQLEEQTLAAAAAALESCSAGVNNTATIVSCTQPTTTAAIRQNLETIYKAIRHVEGATPVQTPNPTPTPEDERREMEEGEPEGSIRVIRQVEDIEASVHDAGNDRQRIKVQLVHPLHMLTTRPTSITVS